MEAKLSGAAGGSAAGGSASAAPSQELAPAAPTGGAHRSVEVHPLVLINISDHVTRESFSQGGSSQGAPRSTGVLFGTQQNDVVSVHESFEMVYTTLDSGAVRFDEEFLKRKKAQCESRFIETFFPFSLPWSAHS